MKIDQTAIDLICNGKGACLDMHDIDKELFPSKEDVLLLLRNLDIDINKVKLNFNNCNYEDKADWLKLYAIATEKIEIETLAKAWSNIVHAMLSQQLSDIKCNLLIEEELKKFVKDNINLCTDVTQLLHDAMEWATSIAANKKYVYETNETKQLSANLLFCCKYISSFDFDLHAAFKTCKSWPSIFMLENFETTKEMLQKSKCCMILYGQHTPQWSQFKALVNQMLASNGGNRI